MKKPFIGITSPNTKISINMCTSQSVTLLSNSYIDIVNDYNGLPVILPAFLNEEQITSFVSILDGLILTSGQDLSSKTYGVKSKVVYSKDFTGIGEPYKRPIFLGPDSKRDQVEISLYHAAKKKGIPILGICRGMQLINVAEGGTLLEEVSESSVSHYVDPDGWINYHSINIIPETLCSKLLGLNNYFVSSIHHQCIDQIAVQLQASAYAEDGIVEIIEHIDKNKFIIGVQGHIEKTRKNQHVFENIFKGFFNQAQKIQKANFFNSFGDMHEEHCEFHK